MRAWLDPSILSRPMAQSVIFHMLIVALAMVGWPFLSKKDINAQPLIIVDVVASLPKTNLAASNRAKSSPELEQEATRKTATAAAAASPTAATGSAAAAKTGAAQAGR